MIPISFVALGVGAASLLAIKNASVSSVDSNIGAFLAVIRQGESSGDYSAYVSFGARDSFYDNSGHPIETGEKGYVIRPDTGELTSAAGAYQIVYSTWLTVRQPDFSPYSQDNAAIELIKRRGAYFDIIAGDIASAVPKLRNEWEMFKQPKWSIVAVSNLFVKNGGVLA